MLSAQSEAVKWIKSDFSDKYLWRIPLFLTNFSLVFARKLFLKLHTILVELSPWTKMRYIYLIDTWPKGQTTNCTHTVFLKDIFLLTVKVHIKHYDDLWISEWKYLMCCLLLKWIINGLLLKPDWGEGAGVISLRALDYLDFYKNVLLFSLKK